jgi:integrase
MPGTVVLERSSGLSGREAGGRSAGLCSGQTRIFRSRARWRDSGCPSARTGRSTTRRPGGCWKARARFHDLDGVVRVYSKSGRTKTEARNNLTSFFHEHGGSFGDDLVQPTTTVAQLVEIWLEAEAKSDEAPRPETLAKYATNLANVLDPGKNAQPLGAYEIRRVRPAIVTAALDRLPSTDMKRKARGNLKRAFDLAVYHEAIPDNPAEKSPTIAKAKNPVQTIQIDDIEVIRDKVREWSVGANRPGPKNHDMPDLVDLLLATGLRIGEVIGLRWSDIDLIPDGSDDDWKPTLSVTGKISSSGRPVREDWTKTGNGIRTFVLPPFAVAMLRVRKMGQKPSPIDAVFATRNGTWYSTSNMQRAWGKIRDAAGLPELDGVTFHTFRRTVATQIDAVLDAERAAGQLGHGSTAVTEASYINRSPVVVDASAATELLGPRSATT